MRNSYRYRLYQRYRALLAFLLVLVLSFSKYCDPLHVILEYIAEERPNCDTVIVHDDDLALLGVLGAGALLEALQPDVVLSCLRSSKPVIHEVVLGTNLSSGNGASNDAEIVRVASLSATFEKQFSKTSGSERVSDRIITTQAPSGSGGGGDLYIDGYIAQMFRPEGAVAYFARLLHVDLPVRSLRFTHSIEWPSAFLICSPQVPTARPFTVAHEHPAWLLDFAIRPIGSVVQQRIWAPQNEAQRLAHAPLNMPIFFVLNDRFTLGLPLVSAAAGGHMTLHGAGTPAPVGERYTILIRINWPGYSEWSSQIMTRDHTQAHNTITVEKFAKRVSSAVCRFIDEASRMQVQGHEARWRIGPGAITKDDVIIIGVVHVSQGSWQPILQLRRYVL